jgi:two-component system, NtrC family, sensor kinase
MTAVSRDSTADLRRRLAELEQKLEAGTAENARLWNELGVVLDRQNATAEILRTIAATRGNAEQALQQIAETSMRLFGAVSATIHAAAEDDGWSKVIRVGESSKRIGAGVPEAQLKIGGRNMPGTIVAENRQVHVGDLDNVDPAIADWPGLPFARAAGTRSMAGSPLRLEGKALGALIVYRDRLAPFSDGELALLQSFADQAAIAVENARLFSAVRERTDELSESLTYQTASAEILKVIASSPTKVEPALKAIVQSACEFCEAYDAVLVLNDGDELMLGAHHGPLAMSRQRWPNDRTSISGRAINDRQPVHVHDVLASELATEFAAAHQMSRRDGCRTMMGVPLLREGEGIGAIVLRRAEVHPFSDKQMTLLQTFADQAVIAIGNVRLFEQVRARSRELAASLQELRTAQDRLIQTEKLASLGQLTAGIAHEIKNPLNFVNNFSAVSAELIDELNDLMKSARLDETMRAEVDELTSLLKDNLAKVVQHGKRADSIVKNMLLHSREGGGDHGLADINALVDESLNLAYHGARAEKPQFNVTLKRNFDPEAGLIEVFPQEITRVFLNLISNGFYAVSKRKADNGDGSFEPTVTATTKGRSDHVEICILDNGTGIPDDVREKMFNPFFTTKPAGEGTGLGLSMSHDIIVKQHGGTIDVKTEAGRFTEFTIVLPRTNNLSNKTRG